VLSAEMARCFSPWAEIEQKSSSGLQGSLPWAKLRPGPQRTAYPEPMALGPLDRRETRESRRPRRSTLALASVTALVLAALIVGGAIAAIALSRGSLKQSPTALADLKLGPFAGHVERAVVRSADGSRVQLADVHGALVPRKPLEPGVRATLTVTVRRPGALAWMLGTTFTKHLTLRTPSVAVSNQWLTLTHSGRLQIAFTGGIAALAVGDAARSAAHGKTLTLNPSVRSGSVAIRVAARSWERLGPRTLVTWFPRSHVPLLVAAPSPAATISPTSSLRLTFSRPVARIFGTANPPLSPSVAGAWTRPNSHTLVFKPTGAGFPLAATVELNLPTVVSANDSSPLTASPGRWRPAVSCASNSSSRSSATCRCAGQRRARPPCRPRGRR